MKRRKRLVLVVALALTLLPPALPAQEAREPAARIEAAMRSARAAGLPVSLLESKVAEGRAKGVEPERIAVAVERRLASALRARAAMQRAPRLTAADLAVGAEAIEAGVAPEVLTAMAASAPAEQRAVAVAVLTQLVGLGEPSAAAAARVQQALRNGPEALQRLAGEAAARQQRQGPPATPPGRSGADANPQGRGPPQGGPPGATGGRGRGPGEDPPGNRGRGNRGRPNAPPGRP